MPVPRDKLILWTACALHQIAGKATGEPMRRDYSVKALLAMMHALGATKQGTEAYWRAMKEPVPKIEGPRVRAANMRKALERILLSLKVDTLFRHDMAEALYGPAKPGSEGYKRMLDHAREQRQTEAAKRRADKDCGWL